VGIENIVKIAVTFLVVAALTGQLPCIMKEIRYSQIKLLQESKASRWGSPDLLGVHQHTNRKVNQPNSRGLAKATTCPSGSAM
jgi:hypothetical protein